MRTHVSTIFYYLWHSSSQQSCEDECQPGASKASGGDNPDGVVRFQDAYSIRNTAQAWLARVGYIHGAAFVIACIIGLIYVSHHFFISRTLGIDRDIYYPITLASSFDEASFYGHRSNAAYFGQWIIGDIHTAEHEGGPVMMSMINPLVLGSFGRLFGSMKNGLIASDFVFPAIIFLLVYAICYELSSHRMWSLVASSLFLFVPRLGTALPPVSSVHEQELLRVFVPFLYGESNLFFSNFEEPKITFVFFAFAVWCLLRAIRKPSSWHTVFAGISFGMLFYTYLYDWATVFVVLALLCFIFAFWFRDYASVKRLVVILIIGFLVSVPYWINVWSIYHLPHASDITSRAGREIGHAFRIASAWKSYLRIMILILLSSFALRHDPIRKQTIAVINAFFLSYIVVLNIQVITGFNIHPDHWYRVQFLPFMLTLFLLIYAGYDSIVRHQQKFFKRLSSKWIAALFLIYFLGGNLYHQYVLSTESAFAKHFTIPRSHYEAYLWLNEHAPKGSVIAALSLDINREVPLLTHHKLYLPHGLLTLASDQEIWNRFFFVSALFGMTPDVFRSYLEKGDMAYYLFEEHYGSHEFDSSFSGYKREFPQEVIEQYTQKYIQYIANNKSLIPDYRLNYIMSDDHDGLIDEDWKKILRLKSVYNEKGTKIYVLQ